MKEHGASSNLVLLSVLILIHEHWLANPARSSAQRTAHKNTREVAMTHASQRC